MTEQTTTSEARTEFAEALGPLYAMWGDAEGHERMRVDLVEAGPAEAARQLAGAEALLEGLATGALDALGGVAGCLLTDAQRLAGRGR
jgi:hypothetical protein